MESNIIDLDSNSLIDALVIPMDEDFDYGIGVCNQLREAGVKVDVYLEGGKFAKKMKYANKLAIPYVIIIGEDEKKTNKIVLKNMESGDQQTISVEEAIEVFSAK